MRKREVLAVLAIVTGGLLQAQVPQQTPLPFIRTSGEASVSAKPDQAEIDIGIVTQASDAQAATSQNAAQTEAVLQKLKSALGPRAEIKTVSYTLSPNYRYPKEGGKPTITGYTANNIVRVKTGDLKQVGPIVDLATQSGANEVHRLQFTLKNDQEVRGQALRQAATQARASAEAIASSLGLKITRILSVQEGSAPPIQPVREMAMMASAKAATPVESGTIDVHAQVTLTVEVGQ